MEIALNQGELTAMRGHSSCFEVEVRKINKLVVCIVLFEPFKDPDP